MFMMYYKNFSIIIDNVATFMVLFILVCLGSLVSQMYSNKKQALVKTMIFGSFVSLVLQNGVPLIFPNTALGGMILLALVSGVWVNIIIKNIINKDKVESIIKKLWDFLGI